MENESPLEQMDEESKSPKQWLQDNLRIIISILIVVAIAAGIYSYSKRIETSSVEQENLTLSEDISTDESRKEEVQTDNKAADEKAPAPAVSQETETSFIESAEKGEGSTHLARRALANYLEKNPDSAITAEHKIYIEDFLRKNTPKKRIFTGTSMEFSKELIQKAIEKSKNLNERQLKNLQKYSVRVPSLS